MEKEANVKTGIPYKEYPICRTCLNVIRHRSYRLQENSGCGEGLKISHVLRYIVPELYLGLSNSPEICGSCRESLRVAYTFRKVCLETETMIGNYLKNVRCTAQVIDLGAVIEYLSNKKVHQAAQKIISEWEDDSCDSSPNTEPVLNKKIPISNLESLKSAVATVQQLSQIPDPCLTSLDLQLKESHHSSTKTHFQKLEEEKKSNEHGKEKTKSSDELQNKSAESQNKSVEPQNKSVEPQNKSVEPESVDLENPPTDPAKPPTDAAKHNAEISKSFKKTEVLKYDRKSGFYLNEVGKKYLLKGDKAVPVKESPEKAKPNQGEIDKSYPKKKGTDLEPSVRVCKETSVLKNNNQEHSVFDETGVEKSKTDKNKTTSELEPDSDEQAPNCEQGLIVCEETGLLTNRKGEYFNFDGTPVEKEQVEAEKNNAKIRGETLFTITNICTVTEDVFNEDKKKVAMPKTDEEEIIPVNLIPKDSEHNPLKIAIRKEYLGNISVRKTADLLQSNVSEFENSPNKGILPRLLEKPVQTIYERNFLTSSCFEKVNMPALTPIAPERNVVLNPFVTNSPQNTQQISIREKPKTNILNFLMDKNLRLPESPTFRLEDNLKVYKKPTSRQATQQKNILEFLPNKNVDGLFPSPTFNDLTNEPSSASLDNLLNIKEEPFDLDLENSIINNDSEDTLSAPDTGDFQSWQNILNSIDDPSSNYIDVPDFVKINNVSITDLETLRNENLEIRTQSNSNINNEHILFNNTLKRKPKETDNKTVFKPITTQSDKTLWDSLPERFPYNGKMLVKCSNYYKIEGEMESNQYEQKQAPSRRRLKLVPVETGEEVATQQKQTSDNQQQERETCVLFTSYTPDGVYVNDHDYLVAPYVRNKVLTHVGKGMFCVCFICGIKHPVRDHVEHMNNHSANCPVCNINLGTSYMLNLHMKSHAKPCKVCTEVVPYLCILDHVRMHKKEEEAEGENAQEEEEEEEFVTDDDDKVTPRKSSRAKTCFVPVCKNSTRNSSKIFIYIPKKNYKKWFKAVGRTRIPIKQNLFWCCEDHFDMKEDCENWQQYKLMNVKLKMKRNVLPHKYISCLVPLPKEYSQLSEESKKIREENIAKLQMKKLSTEMDKMSTDSTLNDYDLDDSMSELFNSSQKSTDSQDIVKRLRSHSLREKKEVDNKTVESETSIDYVDNKTVESETSIDYVVNKTVESETPVDYVSNVKPDPDSTENQYLTKSVRKRSRRSIFTRKRRVRVKVETHENTNKITYTQENIVESSGTLKTTEVTEMSKIPIADENDKSSIVDERAGTKISVNEETELNNSTKKETNNSEIKKIEDETKEDVLQTKTRGKKRKRTSPLDQQELAEKRVLRTRAKKTTDEDKTESPR